MQRHEQPGGGQDDQAEDDRFGRGGADIAEHDLEIGDRRRQYLVDGADEFRKVDAERGVGDALRQYRQHHQPGHDEGAVADALDLGDARADRRAEHHEIQRRRNHRRNDALQQRAPGARHFEQVDGADRAEIHGALTRLTKMSSSELLTVSRSEKRMPAPRRSPSRLVMPVRSPLGIVIVGQLAALIRQFEIVGRERRRDGVDPALQMQLELLACRASASASPCPRPG